MTVRKGIPRLGKHRKEPDFGTKCPEAAGSVPRRRKLRIIRFRQMAKAHSLRCGSSPHKAGFVGAPVGNTPQKWGRKPFRGERQRKAKWRERMRDNPYKDLPPLERRPDGSLYRMTPAQRKQAA